MKWMSLLMLLISASAFAGGPQFDDLTEGEVEDVAKEFSANFSHTGVSAPETNGLWGVEVGLVGGKTASPELADVVERSGGSKSDGENLYHAGLMARVHLPLEIFGEVSMLPEQEIGEFSVKNTSFEVGWNAGGFFNLPVDLAAAINFSNSAFSFKQENVAPAPNATIELESKTRIMWIGVSKTLLFFTPYVKFGQVSAESDISATADILNYSATEKDTVENSGSYLAGGLNIQLVFMKLGAEYSKIMGVSRMSGKISLDF